MKKTFTITAPEGLHARPCALLVSAATRFKAEASLMYNNKSVNLKSIMSVMAQSIPTGAVVTISAEGEDEDALIQSVTETFASHGLGEEC